MKLHRNARLIVKVRELLVDRVENVAGDKLTGLGDLHAETQHSCARPPPRDRQWPVAIARPRLRRRYALDAEIARSSAGEVLLQLSGGAAPTITDSARRPAMRQATSIYRTPVRVV
jgi:hypothetical protein